MKGELLFKEPLFSIPLALIVGALLGFGDACWNTQMYSILVDMYHDQSAQAFSIMKFFQVLLACLLFAFPMCHYRTVHKLFELAVTLLAYFVDRITLKATNSKNQCYCSVVFEGICLVVCWIQLINLLYSTVDTTTRESNVAACISSKLIPFLFISSTMKRNWWIPHTRTSHCVFTPLPRFLIVFFLGGRGREEGDCRKAFNLYLKCFRDFARKELYNTKQKVLQYSLFHAFLLGKIVIFRCRKEWN